MFSYDDAFEIRKLKRKLKKLQKKVIANQVLIDLKFGKIDCGNSKNDSSLQNNISKTNNFFDEELFEKEEEKLFVLDNEEEIFVENLKEEENWFIFEKENLFEKQPINVEPNFDRDPIFDVEPIFEEGPIFDGDPLIGDEPIFDGEPIFEASMFDKELIVEKEPIFDEEQDIEFKELDIFEELQFEEDSINLQQFVGFMEMSSLFIKKVSFLRKEKLQEDVFNDTIKLIVPKLIFIKVEGPPPWKKMLNSRTSFLQPGENDTEKNALQPFNNNPPHMHAPPPTPPCEEPPLSTPTKDFLHFMT